MLFACLHSEPRYHRLLPDEFPEVFQAPVPHHNLIHVVGRADDGASTVFRVLFASRENDLCAQYARATLSKKMLQSKNANRVSTGDLGLLLLTPTVDKQEPLLTELKRAHLPSQCRIVVALGPTPDTIGDHLT